MIKKVKNGVKKAAKKKTAYLTKRVLSSASKKAFRNASENAIKIMGYTIIVKDGFLVRVNADVTREKIKKIKSVKHPEKIVLD